jgi:hypothetical protein
MSLLEVGLSFKNLYSFIKLTFVQNSCGSHSHVRITYSIKNGRKN